MFKSSDFILRKFFKLFTSTKISHELLEKNFLATVPGSSFGPNGEGFIRISYASNMNNLEKAIKRIKTFMNE